jgi:hypothetical protein
VPDRKEPYRSPSAPAERRPGGDDGLDLGSLARQKSRRKMDDIIEAANREAIAARQARLRGGLSLVVGIGISAVVIPAVLAPIRLHFESYLALLAGPALVAFGVWTLILGARSAEVPDDAPPWVRYGGGLSALAGAAVGLLIAAVFG